MKKILVAYFSATQTTAKIAEDISEKLKADLYEIRPKIPYQSKDLNWINPFSRSSREMKGKVAHPELLEKDMNFDMYSYIFLGFPIWWHKAPTIICSFLENYDLKNKKIVLFATSGGNGFGETKEQLSQYINQTSSLEEGHVFTHQYTNDELDTWIKEVLEKEGVDY